MPPNVSGGGCRRGTPHFHAARLEQRKATVRGECAGDHNIEKVGGIALGAPHLHDRPVREQSGFDRVCQLAPTYFTGVLAHLAERLLDVHRTVEGRDDQVVPYLGACTQSSLCDHAFSPRLGGRLERSELSDGVVTVGHHDA
jgi:hypothetical protein